MKRKLLFVVFLFLISFAYSEEVLNIQQLKEHIIENSISDMVSFTENEKPFYMDFRKMSNSTFLAQNKAALSNFIFLDERSKNIDNIKKHLSAKENIFSVSNGLILFDWISTSNVDISIQYTQSKYGIIHGCGTFVIRVFLEDYVYTIRLYDQKNCSKYDEYFNSKKEFFTFVEGNESDPARGIEGTQGYYCKNKDSAELFYNFMRSYKDKNDYAYKFYKVYETVIESVIDLCNAST